MLGLPLTSPGDKRKVPSIQCFHWQDEWNGKWLFHRAVERVKGGGIWCKVREP